MYQPRTNGMDMAGVVSQLVFWEGKAIIGSKQKCFISEYIYIEIKKNIYIYIKQIVPRKSVSTQAVNLSERWRRRTHLQLKNSPEKTRKPEQNMERRKGTF